MIFIIKQFIELQKKLIEQEQWDEFYLQARQFVLSGAEIGQMTGYLLDAGINPLEHLDSIPPHYLEGSPIKSFEIPKGVKTIREKAFQNCEELTQIYIPKSVESIETFAFSGCSALNQIFYEGTFQEWTKVFKYQLWDQYTPRMIIEYNVEM